MTSNSFAGLGRHSFIHLFVEHMDIYYVPGAGLRASPLACGRAGERGTALGSGSLGIVRAWWNKKDILPGTVSFVYTTHTSILKE